MNANSVSKKRRVKRYDPALTPPENDWANAWIGRRVSFDSDKVVAGWTYDPADPGGVTFIHSPNGSRWVPFFTPKPKLGTR